MAIPHALLPGVPFVESPLFEASLDGMELSETERAIAIELNTRGYAVIDFPALDFDARAERIKANLGPRYGANLTDPTTVKTGGNLRLQDAWQYDDDVKAIATHPAILALLGKLYGRAAFPFQTLNFPVGTQQTAHSDAVHFSSQPERFMCGVWVAMEDIDGDAGPLLYYPGSHKWPIISNAMIGRRGWGSHAGSAQSPFEDVWSAMVAATGMTADKFLARKGQALIWAANLLHGGSTQFNPCLTRWSQVTHYYFEDCLYYTPAFSDEALGRLDLRSITNIATGEIVPNRLFGEAVDVTPLAKPHKKSRWLGRRDPKQRLGDQLPEGFDPARYLALNPDVAADGADPATHWLRHGQSEGRRYL